MQGFTISHFTYSEVQKYFIFAKDRKNLKDFDFSQKIYFLKFIITEVLSESTREVASVFSSKTDVFSNLEVQSANFASASAQNFELVSKFTS